MKIHKYHVSQNRINYIFTKSKDVCVLVKYEKNMDFGMFSTSGAIFEIEIHFRNGFKKINYTEINILEVPKCIVSALSFIK